MSEYCFSKLETKALTRCLILAALVAFLLVICDGIRWQRFNGSLIDQNLAIVGQLIRMHPELKNHVICRSDISQAPGFIQVAKNNAVTPQLAVRTVFT
jgi:hypothetical protein